MALADLLNSVEKKVVAVKGLKKTADDALVASNKANTELGAAQAELEGLRNQIHEALGNVFNEPDSRVRTSK